MIMRLTDEQRLDWLRLIRSEGIGPRTFRALINQHGGAAAALEALPGLVRRRGRSVLKIASRTEAEREMEHAARLGIRLIALGEPDYPRTLQAIETAPATSRARRRRGFEASDRGDRRLTQRLRGGHPLQGDPVVRAAKQDDSTKRHRAAVAAPLGVEREVDAVAALSDGPGPR